MSLNIIYNKYYKYRPASIGQNHILMCVCIPLTKTGVVALILLVLIKSRLVQVPDINICFKIFRQVYHHQNSWQAIQII